MATEWYYAKNGRQHGPVAPQELKQLANDGSLQSADLVWKEGMEEWTPAGEVKGLLPYGNVQQGDDIPYVEPYQSRRKSRGPFGQIVLILSALVMITAMFLPWWSMSIGAKLIDEQNVKPDRKEWAVPFARELRLVSRSELKAKSETDDANAKQTAIADETRRFYRDRARFWRTAAESKKWWDQHVRGGKSSFADYARAEAEFTDDRALSTLTLKIWGWNEGIGIMGLVFGAVILVFATIFLAVPPIRSWNWIIALVAALMGLLGLIFSLIWIFTSPGDDVGRHFQQGIVIGPYLLLTGSVLFLIFGIIDAIFGIADQMRKRRPV